MANFNHAHHVVTKHHNMYFVMIINRLLYISLFYCFLFIYLNSLASLPNGFHIVGNIKCNNIFDI